MKIKIERQGELLDTGFLVVYIGDDRYRVTQSIDGKLCINKTSDGESDLMSVHPRSGNEIEIS